MKAESQGVTTSLFFRVVGVLFIVLLFLIVCLVGTVFVAFVVGLVFSRYCQ